MKQLSALLCALSLCSLLLCIVLLLLPLQPLQGVGAVQETIPKEESLFSFSAQELDRIQFKTENHSYTLVNLGDRFALEDFEDLQLDISALSALLEQFPSAPVTEKVLIDPYLQLEIFSTENDVKTLSLTDSGENILLYDGKQTYSYPSYMLEPLLDEPEDWISLNICSYPVPQEALLTLSGERHAEPLQLSYYIEKQNPLVLCRNQTAVSALALPLLEQLCQLNAEQIEQLAPDLDTISLFGLGSPFCMLDAQMDGEQFSLSFSHPQEDGTVYFIKEGTPLLYSAPLSTLPFLSVTSETLLEQNLFHADYEDTTSVALSSEEISCRFTKWDGQVLCFGRAVDEDDFYDFYRLCTTLIPKEALLVDVSDRNLLLRLEFSYTNPQKKTDCVDFYSYNETLCILRINGEENFLIEQKTANKIINACQNLIN